MGVIVNTAIFLFIISTIIAATIFIVIFMMINIVTKAERGNKYNCCYFKVIKAIMLSGMWEE